MITIREYIDPKGRIYFDRDGDALVILLGFEALGAATDRSPKSLMRMFGPKGNPQARNLFEIIAHLQQREGIHLKVQALR